ncbi:hypothetical protein [Neorhizobium sp. P12A]|uniref:hypothetical protein n=1 Tax=Neorhizobium sp. P12A TaxID=2268027 RepID=UPI001FEF9311|nr:hypothetical protein [Neorhizobium sp. P12A]
MARLRFIYTLRQVASKIGENLELIEEVTANSDNISEANSFTSAMAVKMARRV